MQTRKLAQKNISLFIMTSHLKRLALKYSILLLFLIIAGGIVVSVGNKERSEALRNELLDKCATIIEHISAPVHIVRSFFHASLELFYLQDKYAALQQQLLSLQQHNIHAELILQENQQLKKLLNFIDQPPGSFITTKIIGNLSTSYNRFALINAGTKCGVIKGQVVLSNNMLLGRVTGAGESQAQILLLTDLNSNIPFITAHSREKAIAAGNNKDHLEIKYIATNHKMNTGELVLTSGDGELFPANIPIGTISQQADGQFVIIPLVKWDEVEFVQVLQNGSYKK